MNRRSKLLFWTDGFWPRLGGIETQGLQFIAKMQQKGYECLVVAQRDSPDEKEEEIYQGISIRRFYFHEIVSQGKIKELKSVDDYLSAIVKELSIVHLNICVGSCAFVFFLFRNLLKLPLIVTLHAPFFYGNKTMDPLMKKIFLLAYQICCVSNWVLHEIKRCMPTVERKLRLIYNGLSLPEKAPNPPPFSPPTLLMLGRFSSEKGFDTAIRAFAFLKHRGSSARLIIGGEGERRFFLESLVDQMKIQDAVTFMGKLSRDVVFSIMNESTLVIVPSYSESFGLVALEAMQMERAVIASSVGGLPEVVSDGKTGLLVPPQDVQALYLAIESLLANSSRALYPY